MSGRPTTRTGRRSRPSTRLLTAALSAAALTLTGTGTGTAGAADAAGAASARASTDSASEAPVRLLVELDAGALGAEPVTEARVREIGLEQSAAAGGLSSKAAADALSAVWTRAALGYVTTLPGSAVETLRADPRVARVTPDAAVRSTDQQTNPTWGLDRIDQRARPGDNLYGYETTGSGVTAYVLDTGVRLSHTEYAGRASSGYDFVDDDPDASDCDGHGTHVAGTVGGSTYGVAKAVRLVSVRVLGCSGWGSWSDVISALDWVVTNHTTGRGVVNMSLGGGAYSPVNDAVARVNAAGIPVVVAAGNETADACTRSPASAPSAITVAASTINDARSSFSNFGSCVDLFAPGSSVLSSTIDSDTSSGYLSGTSMASPHVAGAVARYLQANPSATVGQVASALTSSATPGVITDARSANSGLLYLAPASVSPPSAPLNTSAVGGDATATVSWDPPVSDGGGAITRYTVRNSVDGTTWTTGGAATAVTVTGLTNGSAYTFTVAAANSGGEGPRSAASNIVNPRAVLTNVVTERFSSPNSRLTPSGGTWRVTGGQYVLSSPASTPTPNANLSIHNTTVTGDFALTVRGAAAPTSATNDDFSVVFGYQDPSAYWYASFSEARVAATNGLFRVTGGTPTKLAEFPTTITPGTFSTVRIEKVGGTVSVLRGGALQGQATYTLPSMRVGLGSRDNGATFDDLVVDGATRAAAPDLVVTAVSTSPATPKAGEAVVFSATVRNRGTAATPDGVILGARFFVDGVRSTFADLHTTSLDPGQSTTITASGGPLGSNSWPAERGEHTLRALVDDINRIPGELDEGNNDLTTTLTVAAAGSPDLVVSDITWSPTSPADGDGVTFSATITNQGTAATPAGVVHGVSFRVDDQLVSWSDTSMASLAPGASRTLTANSGPFGTPFWPAEGGSHTVTAWVDELDDIRDELDETNNQRSTTLVVEDTRKPDLVVTDIAWSPANPSTGNRVTFSATILNQGTAATPRLKHGVAFQVNGVKVSFSDTFLGPLPAGASQTVTANGGPNGTSTWKATRGTSTVTAIVDDTNRFPDELDETNNTRAESIAVSASSTPSAVSTTVGSLVSGGASSLTADDDSFYTVSSTAGATRATSWEATVPQVPNRLTTMSISYRGVVSAACTQTLSVLDHATGAWVALDSRSWPTSELTVVKVPPGTLADYVSGATGPGSVRVRVGCTSSTGTFVHRGEQLRITFS